MRSYGKTADGGTIQEYTLRNSAGMEVKLITYGGILTSIRVPDRHGRLANVVLGFESLAKYEAGHPYFGAITGRYANRIAGGKFTLDGSRISAGLQRRRGLPAWAVLSALTSACGAPMTSARQSS